MAGKKTTPAQERQQIKREWAAKLRRNGHVLTWKFQRGVVAIGSPSTSAPASTALAASRSPVPVPVPTASGGPATSGARQGRGADDPLPPPFDPETEAGRQRGRRRLAPGRRPWSRTCLHGERYGPAAAGGSNEALANSMAASGYGWTGSQTTCLDELWTRESGFDDEAANLTSDARGIAQNINGWSADYQPGDASQQIAWGLSYVAGRYGSPCAAWSHEEAVSWRPRQPHRGQWQRDR